ncbi:MAG TPA: hypothetical protein VNF74_00810 [Terriglobales bacterium]|nr:hypothetical protein [Terriglobales bacterium]
MKSSSQDLARRLLRKALPGYTEFAVRLRYDDLPDLNPAEAANAMAVVERLREAIRAVLGTDS